MDDFDGMVLEVLGLATEPLWPSDVMRQLNAGSYALRRPCDVREVRLALDRLDGRAVRLDSGQWESSPALSRSS